MKSVEESHIFVVWIFSKVSNLSHQFVLWTSEWWLDFMLLLIHTHLALFNEWHQRDCIIAHTRCLCVCLAVVMTGRQWESRCEDIHIYAHYYIKTFVVIVVRCRRRSFQRCLLLLLCLAEKIIICSFQHAIWGLNNDYMLARSQWNGFSPRDNSAFSFNFSLYFVRLHFIPSN